MEGIFMFVHAIIYLVSFVGIWIGAGLAIRSVEHLSKSLRISSFVLSFLILGFFTSVSELSVGINSVIANDPEIYVGNLIGASLVIFLLIVPLLAIGANGLKINSGFQGFNLLFSMLVIAAPVVLSMDGVVDRFDSLICLLSYCLLVFIIQMRKGMLENIDKLKKAQTVRLLRDFAKIIIGLIVIFVASKVVVNETLYFSNALDISPFIISLLLIAVGTNIPELSITVRSLFMKKNQIAFGDYVGSATFNTFLFGFLTLIYGKPVHLTNSYFVSLLFLISGLLIFYYFAKKDHVITRMEGLLLIFIYISFLFMEIILHQRSLVLQ